MTRQRSKIRVLPMALSMSAFAVGGCLFQLDKEPVEVATDASSADAGTSHHDGGAEGSEGAVDASVPALDAAPAILGDTFALTSGARLLTFERATGKIAGALAVEVPSGETLLGVDIRPADGTAFALGATGKLYTLDLQTGGLTLKSTLRADPSDASDPFATLSGTRFGIDFNPVPDRLRIVSDRGQNLRVNVDTGLTITDAPLNPATPGITAAAYTNSFASACRTSLFTIDAAARKLLLQNPPNDGKLSEIGALGEEVPGDVESFEIVTDKSGANLGLVAINGSGGASVATIDLATGGLSQARALALSPGERLTAVFAPPPSSAPPQAPGELLATTESDKLVTFMRGAPAKLCTSSTVTGLQNGERILGADVRPGDGLLYALSDQGNLYTVAVPSGAASLKSRLTAATPSDAFTRLHGSSFAFGFNPVPDRLRVISDTGMNLRINVDDGKVTTDTSITESTGTPAISALAYTNSFAGARSTTLFTLDSALDSLGRVGGAPADGAACPNASNPNCGIHTPLAPLGLGDVDAVNGFDIEATTGVALAALSSGCAGASTLYTVDLSATAEMPRPVATAIGMVGGGERVRSLSFAATPKLTAWIATTANELVSFPPSRPEQQTRVGLRGLAAHERILGIDVRAADGKLYAVGTSGRIYTIADNGQVTEVAMLGAAAGSPFAMLSDSLFGLDFNPAADALRLVTSQDENLRILPSTRAAGPVGATFVDSALTPAGAAVKAAGYTNNFASTARTTLFVIGGDADDSMLYRQGGVAGDPSPNGGVLTSIGALGMGSDCDIGFDVVGGHDGLALVTLEQAGVTRLLSVNLGSAAATPFNTTDSAIPGISSVAGFALTLK